MNLIRTIICITLLFCGGRIYASENYSSYLREIYLTESDNDLTNSVILSNFKFLDHTGKEITEIRGTAPSGNITYLYNFDWDLTKLGGSISTNDYFTFKFPQGLIPINQSQNITVNNTVVGTVTIDSTILKVQFNDKAKNMANYKGNLSIPFQVPVKEGELTFINPDGSKTVILYTYRPPSDESNPEKEIVRNEVLSKRGQSPYADYIEWSVFINKSAQDFGTQEVIVEDEVRTESGSFISLIYDWHQNPVQQDKFSSFYLSEGRFTNPTSYRDYTISYTSHKETVDYVYMDGTRTNRTASYETSEIKVTTSKELFDAERAKGNIYIAYAEILESGKKFRLHLGNNVGTRGFYLRYRTTLPKDDTNVINGATLYLDNKSTLPYETKEGVKPTSPTVEETADIKRNISASTYADVKDRITITKYDENNGKRLPNAVFRLTYPDGITTVDLITGTDGTIQSEILDSGIYTLREIIAPEGYSLLKTPITIEVVYNKATFVNIPNKLISHEPEFCIKPANRTGEGLSTKVGITDLGRAGETLNSWPMLRKGGWIALESNDKGFVITRMSTAQIQAIKAPQEGMMVYDREAKCLKIYNGTEWACFSKPACPTE